MSVIGFEQHDRVRLPGESAWVTVQMLMPTPDGGAQVAVQDDDGTVALRALGPAEVPQVVVLRKDMDGDSPRVLAGMWTQWMSAANHNARTTMLAASTLRPYIHQANAVYGAMLPQPMLRFLLADEPGTGKTIMAGMYLREMQRLGLVRRALVVAPAGLVTKWQADFDRFFGGGLRRVTADTVREHALDLDHDMWVVSLELAAMNPNVQDALRPDKAGWDVVVFDEAHRMTPTATSFLRVGRTLAAAPRALLMTATPHRGSEWLFRHLLHLVDPAVYPDPGMAAPKEGEVLARLRPGPVHFLRRMKESLVHNDGTTKLFKGRTAANLAVPLSAAEAAVYEQALAMVDSYFPPASQGLARMVYGKRAASTLHALRQTLLRRSDHMGDVVGRAPDLALDPYDPDVVDAEEEALAVAAASRASREEKKAIRELVAQIDQILDGGYQPSKWEDLSGTVLIGNGIEPGNGEQAVIFTEYADSADWLERRLTADGYTARVYSGRLATAERDEVRAAFMRREYQIIVSTDAGNEGIDLQSAHVLANYDIPWSLVRLEQRMGRIHRVGQERDVFLYNLIATDTREGDTILRLLDNFVTAANELGGQLFDSLSLVAELAGVHMEAWLAALYGNDPAAMQDAIRAAAAVKAAELKNRAEAVAAEENELASAVEARAALTLMQDDLLERINPAIVGEYLRRLADAAVLTVQGTAHGSDAVLQLVRPAGLPASMTVPGSRTTAQVATSGEELRRVRQQVDTTGVVVLGPGEPAFTDLLDMTGAEFDPDLYRGGAADDVTSLTGYDLYAYTATFTESGGRKTTRWASLIRVDPGGTARRVRWETLANLQPSTTPAGGEHLINDHRAQQAAAESAARDEADQRKVRRDWFTRARTELNRLPVELTSSLPFPQRAAELRRIQAATRERLGELERLIEVGVSEPQLVGHLRVHAAAEPPAAEEANSEQIAVAHVLALLDADGWDVADVQTEGRGYDLRARKQQHQRLVEVKGVWGDAAAAGIRMTGNEVLIAAQHRTDYWLYVIDSCQSGGRLFGAYQDPFTTLAAAMSADAVIRVPGSALADHAQPHQDTP